MKSHLAFFSLILILSGCTSLYKSGQTPDDVYYSPSAKSVPSGDNEDYVQMNNNHGYRYQDSYAPNYNSLSDNYYSYNPGYFSMYNNCLIYSNPFYNNFYSNYWSPYGYSSYGSYYNPYYGHVVIVNSSPINNRPRMFNLNVYNPNSAQRGRINGFVPSSGSNGNTRGNGSNAGNFLRNVFNNSNGSSGSSRTYNSSSNSSSAPSRSSSGGGGGGSAPVRHF